MRASSSPWTGRVGSVSKMGFEFEEYEGGVLCKSLKSTDTFNQSSSLLRQTCTAILNIAYDKPKNASTPSYSHIVNQVIPGRVTRDLDLYPTIEWMNCRRLALGQVSIYMDPSSRAFKRALLDESSESDVSDTEALACVRFVLGIFQTVSELRGITAAGFHPVYINNVFPDGFPGYQGLDVAIYITAGSLHHFIKVTYEEAGPMDILAELKKQVYEETLLQDMDAFIREIEADFVPPGDCLNRFSRRDGGYEIYKSNMTSPGFLSYHQRLRTFPVWFIDGGSIVDSSEPHWTYFTLFKRSKHSKFALVGLASCYMYFQGVDKCRARISQFLILPPYQRQGFGVELLSAVYQSLRTDSSIFEITVEDCSVEMQHLRDVIDIRDVLKTGLVSITHCTPGFVYEKHTEEALKARLKLTSNQLNRVNDLIQYSILDPSDESATKVWRKAIKKRLFALNFDELRPRTDVPDYKHIYIRNRHT